MESPKLCKDFGHQVFGAGNKDRQILNFDPENERTLRKLRKQSKQVHEGSSEEAFEEWKAISEVNPN
ncbi:hypothetical protein PIB30_084432 [Stylosanthes scabra]|uniref:Uncharacterized protein n=1 Tax=Stylosanthes scabra TaxID=79078 RepID=A0ABU6SSV1_9FABA|nr:hypothetical protein [Stylosanthes scabra]